MATPGSRCLKSGGMTLTLSPEKWSREGRIMDKGTFLESFRSLTQPEQVRFLLLLAHELTIVARNYYVPQTEQLEDPVAVRRVNELQHQILGHALRVHEGSPARYPDETIAEILLLECPEDAGLRNLVHWAVSNAIRFVRSAEPTVVGS